MSLDEILGRDSRMRDDAFSVINKELCPVDFGIKYGLRPCTAAVYITELQRCLNRVLY